MLLKSLETDRNKSSYVGVEAGHTHNGTAVTLLNVNIVRVSECM